MMDINSLTPQGVATGNIKSLLSKLFEGWGQGTPQANMSPRLPQEVTQRGADAMRDTMMAAQNSQAAAAPPMPMAPTDAQAQAIAEANANGPMTDANLPASITSQPQAAPRQDTAGMDRMMMALSDPYAEGQNSRIDDATRQRALMWALKNNPTTEV